MYSALQGEVGREGGKARGKVRKVQVNIWTQQMEKKFRHIHIGNREVCKKERQASWPALLQVQLALPLLKKKEALYGMTR